MTVEFCSAAVVIPPSTVLAFSTKANEPFGEKFTKSNYELEDNLLPLLTKFKLLESHEHNGYFYSINNKKDLIIAKNKLKKLH